nr:hypothetical protein CFP56_21072 [Quercus suber]
MGEYRIEQEKTREIRSRKGSEVAALNGSGDVGGECVLLAEEDVSRAHELRGLSRSVIESRPTCDVEGYRQFSSSRLGIACDWAIYL